MKAVITSCFLIAGCAQTKSKTNYEPVIPHSVAKDYCDIRNECQKLAGAVGIVDKLSECHDRQQAKAKQIKDTVMVHL